MKQFEVPYNLDPEYPEAPAAASPDSLYHCIYAAAWKDDCENTALTPTGQLPEVL